MNEPSPNSVASVVARTAAWLGVDPELIDYIDEESIAEDLANAVLESEHSDVETIGGKALNSLYYNRPGIVTDSHGNELIAYFRDCTSAPRKYIPRRSVYQTISAGLCSASPRLGKGKMFYYA